MRRVPLAILPTRLEKESRLSEHYGIELYIKHDETTEFVGSGNKIRKLEFLMAEALSMGATTVFTCGGVQSNHARATVYVCRKLGLNPVIFLRSTTGDELQGNFLLNTLMGSEIIRVTKEEYENIDEIFSYEKEKRERRGERVYIIPEGGTNATGIWGYVKVIDELEEQTNLEEIEGIYCAVGSGGTALGLAIGLEVKNYRTQVFGVNVTKRPGTFYYNRMKDILKSLEEKSINLPHVLDRIHIMDEFSGPGYAIPTDDDLKIISEVASISGMILDPVYTAKAFRGMVESARKSRKYVFIHTGGTFGIFAFAKFFERR